MPMLPGVFKFGFSLIRLAVKHETEDILTRMYEIHVCAISVCMGDAQSARCKVVTVVFKIGGYKKAAVITVKDVYALTNGEIHFLLGNVCGKFGE